MHLFHITTEDIKNSEVTVRGEDAHHILKVLRMKKGDLLFFTDSRIIYKGKITETGSHSLKAALLERKEETSGKTADLCLYIALVRFPCFERILDEATQLGVKRIVPIRTAYTQNIPVRPDRFSRWQKIIRQAARQSFNAVPPVLTEEIIPFPQAVPRGSFAVLLDPYSEMSLKEILRQKGKAKEPVHLIVGPEAGFSREEIGQAEERGIRTARLPSFILRTETAVVAALSDIIFYYDEQQPDHH